MTATVPISRGVAAADLDALVARLAGEIPFWSDRLGATPPSFADVAPLTRADVQHHSPYDFLDPAVNDSHLLYCESTGTTGEPLSSFHRLADITKLAGEVQLPTALSKVLQPGVVVANALPYEMGFVGQACSALLRAARATEIPVSTRTTVCPPERAVAILRKLRPQGLFCLPIDAECYAQIMIDDGFDPAELGIEVIVVSSEPSADSRRAALERLYGAKVVNFYGASELGAVAVPCDEGKMHFRDKTLFGEIAVTAGGTDRNTAAATDRVTGELIITTLADRAMPMLRYATRDVVTVDFTACACGQQSPTVDYRSRLGGEIRIGDRQWTPLEIEDLIYQVEAGPWYRFEVQAGQRVQIAVETRAERSDEIEARLGALASRQLGVPVAVNAQKPGELYEYRAIRGRKPMSRIVENDDIVWAS